MRSYLIILLFLLLSFPLLGQEKPKPLKKNQNIIGVFVYPWTGNMYNYWDVNLRYGRFLTDKINTGLQVNSYFANELSLYNIELRPFVRYYILNKKFSPVVEVNYNINLNVPNKHNPDFEARWHSINLEIGIAANNILIKRIGFEIMIGYGYVDYINEEISGFEVTYPTPSFLITYKFPK